MDKQEQKNSDNTIKQEHEISISVTFEVDRGNGIEERKERG